MVSVGKQLNLDNNRDLFSLLCYFIFIHILESKLPKCNINTLNYTVILITQHNNLSQPFECHSSVSDIKFKILDLSFNKITNIARKHFLCLTKIH